MADTVNSRYDFVLFFDVADGNPNGDPDAGNLPRVDPQTGHGLVTDVCLKRKIRNFVSLSKPEAEGYDIYVKEKAVLNQAHQWAHGEAGVEKGKKPSPDQVNRARDLMCRRFFDIRTFGAVMTTEVNAGQVRGPVQLTFGRSVDPVVSLDHAITRMAVTNERDLEKERTMGRKFTIPYALYRAHGFISAPLAQQTGFSEDDLALLWQAFGLMFEHDRSAARGLMTTRRLIAFKHTGALGSAPAHALFDLVSVQRANGEGPVRRIDDYTIVLDQSGLPSGVEVLDLV